MPPISLVQSLNAVCFDCEMQGKKPHIHFPVGIWRLDIFLTSFQLLVKGQFTVDKSFQTSEEIICSIGWGADGMEVWPCFPLVKDDSADKNMLMDVTFYLLTPHLARTTLLSPWMTILLNIRDLDRGSASLITAELSIGKEFRHSLTWLFLSLNNNTLMVFRFLKSFFPMCSCLTYW